MQITVYTKSDCIQCEYTKKELDRMSLEYTAVDVAENDDARMFLQDKGITALPFVIADEQCWAGFKPTKIRALADCP